MSNLFFYTGIISLCVGVLLGTVFDVLSIYWWWLCFVALALCVAGRKKPTHAASRRVLLGGFIGVLLALGAVRAELYQQKLTLVSLPVADDVQLEGIVVREPQQRERTTHVYVETAAGLILVYADRYQAVRYGDAVTLQGEVARPESFTTDLGRTFNYPGYLAAKGVTHVMYYPTMSIVGARDGNVFFEYLYAAKDAFRAHVQTAIVAPQSALGEGLLLGVGGVLGTYWETIFRQVGIIHIVVLSGYNVMLVILFVQYVLSYVLPYRARIVFGFVAIIAFAVLVGLSATVVRASVMASLLLLLQFSGNVYNVLRGLFLAGALMLLWNPLLLLYDPGFQLSFLATFGLILCAPYIERWVRFVPSVLSVREFLVATLATQLFVLPFLLYQIGEFSVVAVIVNVLVLPMVPLAMLLTFFAGLAGFIAPSLALVFGALAQLSLTYILRVAELFSAVPFASFAVPAFPLWVVFVSYGLLGYFLYYIHTPRQTVVHAPGWTIEEESEVRRRIMAATPSAATTNDTPIFFR